jgi:ATP-dependent DNA ligase
MYARSGGIGGAGRAAAATGRVAAHAPTAARELPADQAGWAFEPKWDGYRALGHVVGGGSATGSTTPGVDDPAPVFVRPELAVEVSLLGWESDRPRHPAYSGLSRIL